MSDHNPLSPVYTTVCRDCLREEHEGCTGWTTTGYTAPLPGRPWQMGPETVHCTCTNPTHEEYAEQYKDDLTYEAEEEDS